MRFWLWLAYGLLILAITIAVFPDSGVFYDSDTLVILVTTIVALIVIGVTRNLHHRFP